MTSLNENQISAFKSAFPTVKEYEGMALHTYLKIGGVARFYFVANSTEELLKAVEVAKVQNIPRYVMGGGSNLLVSDDGFEGVVIQCGDRSYSVEGTRMVCAPGAFTGLVARASADAALTGFEWGVGVPGLIGGATYGNAGCFGGEMKDAVESVEALRIADMQRVTYTNAECQFAYRESRFKHEPHVILKTVLQLQPGDKATAKAKIDEIMAKRKDTQPQGAFTAGCLFKNFEYQNESDLEKLRREDEVPEEFLKTKKIPAGWLIDKLGLKGTTVGKAQVSPVHGNFLVNLGGAKAQDVIALSSLVKMKVRDELGILLEDEVQYLGF
jgi:UDP-N-acetylmuramate dehydrogenase